MVWCAMKHQNRGVILLEALVALAILGSIAIALVTLAARAVRLELADRADERALGAADRVLAASSLLTRVELEQRIGSHQVGEFAVSVARPEPGLYRIGIAPIATPEVALLVTVVHRAVPGLAQ